jgi:hypothetical protein
LLLTREKPWSFRFAGAFHFWVAALVPVGLLFKLPRSLLFAVRSLLFRIRLVERVVMAMDADTIYSCLTYAASEADLRDHAVGLMKRWKCHGLRRRCDG